MQLKDIVIEYSKGISYDGEFYYSIYLEGAPRLATRMFCEMEVFDEHLRGVSYAASVLGYNVVEFMEIEV